MSKRTRTRHRKRDDKRAAANAASERPQLVNWAVAFLDILGYSKVLDAMDVVPLPSAGTPEAEAIIASLAKAVRLRRRLHQMVPQFISSARGSADQTLSSLPGELRASAGQWRQVEVVATPGPDHYVLAAPLSHSARNIPIRSVYALVTGAASAALIQLALGSDDPEDTRPLRGGVDLAPGALLMPERFLYSPALVRAYKLEGKAVYPRIAVGDRFAEYLDAHASPPPEAGIAGRYASIVAAKVREMLFTDLDGQLTLDFYGEAVRGILGPEPARTIGKQAWEYAIKACVYWNTRGDQRIAAKYEWLIAYMEPRKHFWE